MKTRKRSQEWQVTQHRNGTYSPFSRGSKSLALQDIRYLLNGLQAGKSVNVTIARIKEVDLSRC